VKRLALSITVLSLAGTALAQPPSVSPPPTPSNAEEDIVDRALRQTVLIEGDGSYGSGIVLVPKRGLILTNWHVVEDMKAPRVTFFDGKSGFARVVDSDKGLDLALLQGPATDAPAPEIGDAIDLRAAQPLYAIGSPRKLGFTVSRGIVSYMGRNMDGTRFIQTDLPINEGNSGGPVITSRGCVVGVMSFILRRSTGLAFALPINYAIERFAGRLPELSAKHAYLDRFKSWKSK
jgi:S1-C subfamily serine protease